MTDLTKLIKRKMREKNVILGYNKVMKAIKTKQLQTIIYATNLPKEKLKIVKHNARIGGIEVKEYSKDSVELGLVCGKPFAVSILAIKGSKK